MKFEKIFTYKKFVLGVLSILLISSLISTRYILKKIKEDKKRSSSIGEHEVRLTDEYNIGVREFTLSVFVPLFTSVFNAERPLSG
ncbi:hypothetical protein NX86_06495, partial [Streptococcus phocae subsp. salmonis]|uniref:hypothetical protein n=1 Tax=Streptococcus phocae TaxID=119224 RepID=UPI00053154BB